MSAVGLADVERAEQILHGVVHRTPILASEHLSALVGGRLLVKSEHLQRTGSFKIRGAYVRIAQLTDAERPSGVVAASAGNHAQGVAWAARALGVPATVVMPVYASLSKVEATRGYGATVELGGETFEESLDRAEAIAANGGATLVHAFDDPWVMAGQGTVGLEVCADAPQIDRIVVPIGGGGLISGIATAVRALRPQTRIVGVRPSRVPDTVADGAAVASYGEHTSPVIEDLVDDVVKVDDERTSEAIVLFSERMKQVVEGAGALGLAAMLSGAIPSAGTTLLVASGGNIDPGQLMRVIRHGLGEAGRYLYVRVMLADRPGRLLQVLDLLAEMVVNVLSVVHHRAGPLPLGTVEVELTLECRDRDHAAEVVRTLTDAGYDVRV